MVSLEGGSPACSSYGIPPRVWLGSVQHTTQKTVIWVTLSKSHKPPQLITFWPIDLRVKDPVFAVSEDLIVAGDKLEGQQ